MLRLFTTPSAGSLHSHARVLLSSCLLHRHFSTVPEESRVLITGGQGFIGAWIAKQLLDENEQKNAKNEVTVLDHKYDDNVLSQVLDPSQLKRLHRTYGDVADTDYIQKTIDDIKPHIIIHMAALQIPTCRVNPILGAKVNVVGTLNIYEAVRKLREKTNQLPNIVYASSAAVAGNPLDYGDKPILDNTPHTPLNHYGVFKIANEGAARIYWHDHKIPSVGLRPFTVYGVGREVGLTSAPTKAIKAAILGRPFNIPFTGNLCINYAEDLARVFIKCGRTKFEGHYALNIKGEVVSIDEWVRVLESVVPSAKGTIKSSGGPLPFPVYFDEAGLSKLLNENPVKITPVLEGIKRTVQKFNELKKRGVLHDRDLA